MGRAISNFPPMQHPDELQYLVEHLLGSPSAAWRAHAGNSSSEARAECTIEWLMGIKDILLNYPEDKDKLIEAINNVLKEIFPHTLLCEKIFKLYKRGFEGRHFDAALTFINKSREEMRVVKEEADTQTSPNPGAMKRLDSPEEVPETIEGLIKGSTDEWAFFLMGVRDAIKYHPSETNRLTTLLDIMIQEAFLYTATYQAALALYLFAWSTGLFMDINLLERLDKAIG